MIYLKTGVGIELRGDDILLAAVQSNFSKAAFTSFLRITDYPRFTRADLSGAIGRFFRDNGLGRESVVLGVSRKDCVIRQLDLPLEVKENLGEVVRYQVQAFEPTEEEGFYYDYTLLEGAPGQKRLTIFLAMVRKSFLDKQLALLRELGIRPLSVAFGSAGLANLYLAGRKNAGDKTFFLADAGTSGLELFALRNGQLVYSREVSKNDEQSWGDFFLGEINEAAAKMRLGPDSVLEKIALAGESSQAVYEEIRERIPDCELLDRFFPLAVNGIDRQFVQESAAVCGLAFTAIAPNPAVRLNLLPPTLKRREGRWGAAVAAVLGAVVLLLLAAPGVVESAQSRRLLARLKEETRKLDAPVREVRDLETRLENIEAQRKLTTELLNDEDRNLDVLRELTLLFPYDTFLRSYTNRNNAITISGNGSYSELMSQLEKSPLLKDVRQRGSITKVQGLESFTIDATLKR